VHFAASVRPRDLIASAGIAAVVAVTAACGSSATTSTSITAPASTRCQASVTGSALSFGPGGGTGTLAISVDRECSWRATSPVDWVTFTTSVEGQGDGTVGFRVVENAEPVPRQAALTVAERQITLAQQPAPCRYALGGAPEAIGSQGGDATIDLDTHIACSWTAQSEQAWATVTPGSGSGAARIRVSVVPNTGPERPVVVSVAGHRVSMTQRAPATVPTPAPNPAPAPAPPPPPPSPSPSPTPTPEPAPTPSPSPSPSPTPSPSPSPTPSPSPSPTPPAPSQPQPVREIELEGELSQLTGSCPDRRFTLQGRTVYTTASTQYQKGNCNTLKNKADVEVKGMLMSDGTVRADRVKFDD